MILNAEDILSDIHEYVYMSATNYNDVEKREILLNAISKYLSDKFNTIVNVELYKGHISATHMYNVILVKIFDEQMSMMSFTKNIDKYITQFNRTALLNKIL